MPVQLTFQRQQASIRGPTVQQVILRQNDASWFRGLVVWKERRPGDGCVLGEGPVGIHAEVIIAVVGGSGDRSKPGRRIPRYLRYL